MNNTPRSLGAYKAQTLANSEIAIQILNELKEGESYSKPIAEELDTTQTTISSYLKGLRDHGLIERTERTKAQYYGITEKGEQFLKKKREKDEIIREANKEIISFLEGGSE